MLRKVGQCLSSEIAQSALTHAFGRRIDRGQGIFQLGLSIAHMIFRMRELRLAPNQARLSEKRDDLAHLELQCLRAAKMEKA
jgi:hypothetical protein